MNVIELLRDDHKKCLALISELYHAVKQIEGTELDVIDCERMEIFVEFRDALLITKISKSASSIALWKSL